MTVLVRSCTCIHISLKQWGGAFTCTEQPGHSPYMKFIQSTADLLLYATDSGTNMASTMYIHPDLYSVLISY